MNAKQQYKWAYGDAKAWKPTKLGFSFFCQECVYMHIPLYIAASAWLSYRSTKQN